MSTFCFQALLLCGGVYQAADTTIGGNRYIRQYIQVYFLLNLIKLFF